MTFRSGNDKTEREVCYGDEHSHVDRRRSRRVPDCLRTDCRLARQSLLPWAGVRNVRPHKRRGACVPRLLRHCRAGTRGRSGRRCCGKDGAEQTREAPPSKLGGTGTRGRGMSCFGAGCRVSLGQRPGDAPESPMGRVGQVGRVRRTTVARRARHGTRANGVWRAGLQGGRGGFQDTSRLCIASRG